MPRKKLIISEEYPYHITNRSNNKDFFYLEMEELWDVFDKHLFQMSQLFECKIHTFVLMSNHFHLLISTPKGNLSESMKYLHREVARDANKRTGRINHFFGGRYKWCLVNNETYCWNAIRYILQNPVRANMCNNIFDYQFSSFNNSFKKTNWEPVEIFDITNDHLSKNRNWLDKELTADYEHAIAFALRRKTFTLPKNKSKKQIEIDIPHSKKGTVTF